MLTLTIKKQWYDMILSGEKTEEYRDIKSYYTTRFKNNHLLRPNGLPNVGTKDICFRNGYSTESPSFVAECYLSIGPGRTEWGAGPGTNYYILHIVTIK